MHARTPPLQLKRSINMHDYLFVALSLSSRALMTSSRKKKNQRKKCALDRSIDLCILRAAGLLPVHQLLELALSNIFYLHPARLLVSASPNQLANNIFLSQKTSISQSKPALAPTSEQALKILISLL